MGKYVIKKQDIMFTKDISIPNLQEDDNAEFLLATNDNGKIVKMQSISGGDGAPRIHDYKDGRTYNKDEIVVSYDYDVPAIYRSLENNNKSHPASFNPWVHIGDVASFSDWSASTTYSKGSKAKYLYAGSFTVLIEAMKDSPGNPEETLFQEWKSLGVLSSPEAWDPNKEYAPLDSIFHTSVSIQGAYYSTSVPVKGTSPVESDRWEKLKEIVLDENSFREIQGKVHIGLDPDNRLPDPNENSDFALGTNRVFFEVEHPSAGIYSSSPDTIDSVNHSTSSVGVISTDENISSSFIGSTYHGSDRYINSNVNSVVTSLESSMSISTDASNTNDSSAGKFSSTLSLSSTNDHSIAKLGVANKEFNEISLTASRSGFKIKDSIFNRGFEYDADYSEAGEKSDRWIPDWGTVKNNNILKAIPLPDDKYAYNLKYNDNEKIGVSYDEGAIDLSKYYSTLPATKFGKYSLTFGEQNTNGGWHSLTGGLRNITDSVGGLTMGNTNENTVDDSAVFGEANIVKAKGSVVIGRGSTGGMEEYSRSWVEGNPVFVVGNGTQKDPKDSYILYNDGKSLQWGVAKYNSKLHDDYDDRSLVDKEYVDTSISDITLDDVTGKGNLTESALQVTGGANANYELDSMVLKLDGASSHIMNISDEEQSGGLIIGEGRAKLYANGSESLGAGLEINTVDNISKFDTRVAGIDAVESNEFVTKFQLDSIGGVLDAVIVPDPDVVTTAITVAGFGNEENTTYSEGSVDFAVSRGSPNTLGKYSFRAGRNSIASGKYSAAFGAGRATDENSFAAGLNTEAKGPGSVALGMYNVAEGMYSVSMGNNNNAASSYSTAFGSSNTTYNYGEIVAGRFCTTGNTESSYNVNSPAFRIGAGTSNENRLDSFIIYNNGKSLQKGIAEYDSKLHDQYTDRTLVDMEFVVNLLGNHVEKSAGSPVDSLVSPTEDYADMTEVTAAIKSIIDALKA